MFILDIEKPRLKEVVKNPVLQLSFDIGSPGLSTMLLLLCSGSRSSNRRSRSKRRLRKSGPAIKPGTAHPQHLNVSLPNARECWFPLLTKQDACHAHSKCELDVMNHKTTLFSKFVLYPA